MEPLYTLEKEGGFKKGDARGAAFAATRLAAGAQAVRDMIVQAWEESANTPIGCPMVNVGDIERGKLRATRAMFGSDLSRCNPPTDADFMQPIRRPQSQSAGCIGFCIQAMRRC